MTRSSAAYTPQYAPTEADRQFPVGRSDGASGNTAPLLTRKPSRARAWLCFLCLTANRIATTVIDMDYVAREILLSFWKVHILCHAAVEPVTGQWIMRELRRHGYEVSPGTLYPLLSRMRKRGWLRVAVDAKGGRRARRDYSLTKKGAGILALLKNQVNELYREVVKGVGASINGRPRPRLPKGARAAKSGEGR
jgi:PadR family transcriptional regulator PadR